ncbi:hypothetical protein F5887DRAFT_951555 [Amanita rubescens]|nr:hypothetical protein F5887DRAFT_951555 [Amanita rubescens]
MARFASVALLIFLATLIGHVFARPIVKRNVNQLEGDLELFNGDIDGLSQAIDQYTVSSHTATPQSDQLPSAFETSNSDLQQCINDINSITTINTADAEIVLKLVKDFTPNITGMLKNLQKKKAAFREFGIAPFILSQVQSLYGGVTKLIDTLDKVIPANSQGVANALQANMGPEFRKTISLYSSK